MKSAKTPIKKWGTRQQASPLIPKSGGLEPSGPIGVYAYVPGTSTCLGVSALTHTMSGK